MNKNIKTILITSIILVITILLDSIQALIFNNKPLFKIREYYDGGNIHYIDKGLLVDTYSCSNGKKDSVIKGFSYSCSYSSDYEIVDTSKDIENFVCAEALEKIYEDDKYTYYLNCMKSDYIEVRYNNARKEKLTKALQFGHISINDLDKFNIDYTKYPK